MNEEQTRLLALAHLKTGKKPQEVADLTGLTYAKSLKLKKQLHEAEENDAMFELFNLEEAALDILINSVRQGLEPVGDAFGLTSAIEGELEHIQEDLQDLGKLDSANQEAAMALAHKIKTAALLATNSNTVVELADALCKLQTAFFGQGIHNPNGGATGTLGLPSAETFEKYLKD